MLKVLSRLACATVASLAAGALSAAAQTVVVRDAPPGATVEVKVNAEPVRTATADRLGDATLMVTAPPGSDDAGVRIVIDRCGQRVRVSIVSPGVAAEAAPATCTRTDVPWTFVMRPVTSFVVDLAGPQPTVHLTQGAVPAAWLDRTTPTGPGQAGPRFQPPLGFLLAGNTGFGTFGNLLNYACGTASCVGSDIRPSFEGGLTYWFKPNFGAYISGLRPTAANIEGAGNGFTFTSKLESTLITATALVGAAAGRIRPFGEAGFNYHRATFTQDTTINSVTVTIDDVPTTFPGGSTNSRLLTRGWGPIFGGGVEIWLSSNLAVYGGGRVGLLRGGDANGGEAKMDDRLTLFMVGIRYRLSQ